MRVMTRAVAVSTAAALAVLAVVTACSGGSGGAGPAPAVSPSTAPSESTAAPRASPSGSLPPEAAAQPAGTYYAVFLAVAADAKDALIAAAQAHAKRLGYEGGVGELGCTQGAQEQLHLKAGDVGFSVFFDTRAQAQQLVAAYGDQVVGIAHVTASCLDN